MANPKKFQQCTIKKVITELFLSKRSGPRRFLVADEVGLGKTIIAKHVINHLRESNGRKVIIYVSSSLDITKQNRSKLTDAPEKEIVHADRINLLFENGGLNKGIQIISMTPGTSLSLGSSLGSSRERKYMATLARRHYPGLSYDKAATAFMGHSKFEYFYNSLKEYKIKEGLPISVEKEIYRRWDSVGIEDSLKCSFQDSKKMKAVIRIMRKEMAKAILNFLNPSLVIFDEFQKFKEITEMKSDGELSHELGKILLKDEIPTLLLSATPYRLFTGSQFIINGQESTGHYHDLIRIFTFLVGSSQKAHSIVSNIQNYGNKIQTINETNVRTLLESKEEIQNEVMKFMSRAERINFEGQNESTVNELFLSESDEEYEISKENILEFLKVAKHSASNKMLLTYWKSGTQSMSYLDKYKLIENACLRSEISGEPLTKDLDLYSRLKKDPRQHIKIKYLFDDVLNKGDSFGYLWLPATRPYYNGEGIYSKEKLLNSSPKKGLVFSSWSVVPRMIAAELGSMKNEHYKRASGDKEIKASGESWAKLFFPSTLLAEVLLHRDFVETKSYKDLFNKARDRIELKLISHGFKISDKGRALALYNILAKFEFIENREKWDGYNGILNGRRFYNLTANADKGDNLSKLIPIDLTDDELSIHSETLNMMAEIAISSPSVCYLRAITNMMGRDLSNESWLYFSSFCIHSIRSFVNRSGHVDAILKHGRGDKPLDKAFNYFKAGNFQSVVDEYIYQIFNNKSDDGAKELFKKLSQIYGSSKAYCYIKTSKSKGERVNNDIICCFGEGAEESNSRDLNREAFNSPFWPFLLATTSVGQEGLDFHLYCNDIYHWNLPTNPVDFEQREGRLNRFNNYMIRKNIAQEQVNKKHDLKTGEVIWDSYLENARQYACRSDRYNLGMSPNWVFTSKNETLVKFNRHIMDLPCSNDRDQYDRLMRDLGLYRLALGQPNQREYLESLHRNSYYRKVDPRGIVLNFFPFKSRERKEETKIYLESKLEVNILLDDCLDYLIEIKDGKLAKVLEAEVDRHIKRIRNFIDLGQGSHKNYQASIEALYYFVDPFDDHSDRDPEIGFEDDLEVLKAA